MALELVKRGLAKATLFNVCGEVVHPSEVLYGKPIIVERGSFRPSPIPPCTCCKAANRNLCRNPVCRAKI